jgi:transposase InsO family protein
MECRIDFVRAVKRGGYSIAELCRLHGISRQTGYETLRRYQQGGVKALEAKSRAPKRIPHKTPRSQEEFILELRRRHGWGAKKIRKLLERENPSLWWPAVSTITEILKRHGMVEKRTARRRASKLEAPVVQANEPNDVWSCDFKGQFLMGDHQYCYPLTVADRYSRYLLECEGMHRPLQIHIRERFTILFSEYGLPSAVLSDGGFVGRGLGQLSRLSVWWIRLGIYPLVTQPGRPDQNGRHERMHRTLKAETARPPRGALNEQQACFDSFRETFNNVRPHEALSMRTPAELYRPSSRSFPRKLPQCQYPGHFELRKADNQGSIKFKGHRFFLAHPLAHEIVGLEEVDDALWSIFFGPIFLARFCLRRRALLVPPITKHPANAWQLHQ